MTQQASEGAAPTPEATSPNGQGVIVPQKTTTSLKERLDAEFGTGAAPTEADANGQDPAALAASVREKRLAEIRVLTAKESERIALRKQAKDAQDAVARADRAERQLAQLNQQFQSRIDPASFSDPATFLEAAKRANVPAKQLGEWIQAQVADPALVAAHQAKRIVDPQVAALEAKLAEERQRREAFEAQYTQRAAEEHAVALGESMLSFTREQTAQAPLSAGFLEHFGPEEFLKIASSALQQVPQGRGWEQATLDVVEDQLSQLTRIVKRDAQQPSPSTPKPAVAPAPPRQMQSISNESASGRSSLVDTEAELSKLSFEERIKRAFA